MRSLRLPLATFSDPPLCAIASRCYGNHWHSSTLRRHCASPSMAFRHLVVVLLALAACQPTQVDGAVGGVRRCWTCGRALNALLPACRLQHREPGAE